MKNQFKGCIKFSIKGKNLYRFINALRDEHLNCFNQYCKNDTYYGEVSNSDFRTVKALAEDYDMELDFFEYETLRKKLYRYRHRYGIFAGFILILFAIIYFSNIVMTIEIHGNSKVSDTVILSVLEEAGIEKGTFLSSIDFSSCERKLRITNPDISWAGIRHTGNRLVVEITEVVPAPDVLAERIPCNIISMHNAQITAVSILNGNLIRGTGDYVREGDLLVSGVVRDAREHTILHHSIGSITGIYEDSVTFHQDYCCESYEYTGKFRNERYLNLFNLKIPLFIGKNSYDLYSSETYSSSFQFLKHELPSGITNVKIAEQMVTQKIYSREEAENIINEKIFIYEKNFLSDVKIIERDIQFSENQNGLDCNVKYTVEGEIGTQKEIYVK